MCSRYCSQVMPPANRSAVTTLSCCWVIWGLLSWTAGDHSLSRWPDPHQPTPRGPRPDLPRFVHLPEVTPLLAEGFLQPLEQRLETAAGRAQSLLRVHVQPAGQARQREQGVAQFVALLLRRRGLPQLAQLLFERLPGLLGALPGEAGPRGAPLDRLGAGQGGPGGRDAAEGGPLSPFP